MTLTALIDRVRTGTGEDRELEMDLLRFLDPTDYANRDKRYRDDLATAKANGLKNRDVACLGGAFYGMPRLTTSLDAVVRLIEEKLPGWWWNLSMHGGAIGTGKSVFHARLMAAEIKNMSWGVALTPSRALLHALLLALQAQEAEGT